MTWNLHLSRALNFVGNKREFVDINTKLIKLDGYCCNILGWYLIMVQVRKYVAITCH